MFKLMVASSQYKVMSPYTFYIFKIRLHNKSSFQGLVFFYKQLFLEFFVEFFFWSLKIKNTKDVSDFIDNVIINEKAYIASIIWILNNVSGFSISDREFYLIDWSLALIFKFIFYNWIIFIKISEWR